MIKKLLYFACLLFFITQISAQCTLTALCTGGNWNSAATWSPSGCGAVTVPGNNMIVVIPTCSPSAGAIVTVNINSPSYQT